MQERYPLHKVIIAISVIWLLLPLAFCVAVPWYQARRPVDMPNNSIWIDAPHIPFGFYHGWWQGCSKDNGSTATKCKPSGAALD
jgi:hypothetical protein